MAATVSHAMRRYPSSPPDTAFSSYRFRGDGSQSKGESALSRSMRYADPWLYGSVRGPPGGFLLAPAFVLCSCPDYVNGTKRSSKKSPTTCKKCKGARLPLPASESARFGTVRCYPTVRAATSPVRAGTVRVSSSSRPTVLPAADPYDLMRRSRLSVTDGGSQFRARSTSPGKARGGESRSHSATRSKDTDKKDHQINTIGRRSILECDINPYELMSSEENGITMVNGQRIRVRPASVEDKSNYENVQMVNAPKVQADKNKNVKSPPELPNLNENESDFINRFKSILKKPSATFSDTDPDNSESSPLSSLKSGSHFYLPTPYATTPRKKVQFSVENVLANRVKNQKNGLNDKVVEFQEDDANYADSSLKSAPDLIADEKEINEEKSDVEEHEKSKVCSLRRSHSDVSTKSETKVTFNDTMALRQQKKRPDARMHFKETDLEKLDGITSRTRKISNNAGRPNVPPPPPPKIVVKSQENKDTNIFSIKDKTESYKKSTNAITKDEDKNTDKVIKETQKDEKEINDNVSDEPIFENKILDNKNVENNAKETFILDNKIEEVPKEIIEDKLPTTEKPSEVVFNIEINNPMPPSAPPRKRSGNKQPLVNVITQSLNQMVKIESPTKEYANKTVVQISSPPAIHKLQIKNEFADVNNIHNVSVIESPQRKTSILINGDDCYCTVNVNDDVPIYQSSVVVKDSAVVDFIPIKSTKKSTVYITGNFTTNEDKDIPRTVINSLNKTNNTIDNQITDIKELNNFSPLNNMENQQVNTKKIDNKHISSELLTEILKDPVEAVRRNLVPHVCGKADVIGKQRDKKLINNKLLDLIDESFKGNFYLNSLEDSLITMRNNHESIVDDLSSEHSSSTQYELMDQGSDCYTDHSNRSSVTEEEISTRTKFYELLEDSAVVEVLENEEHHYESVKVNNDPIYEDIEIPPPLPTNPPPSSIIDDINLDKEFTTRSIFEGASKYDILSYLVDAKERGITQEDNYNYPFTNSTGIDNTKESFRVSQMSTVSDSSEDNSLILSGHLEDKGSFQKTSEIERNDSGVGSETSKSSLTRYRVKQDALILCEDCEGVLESKTDNNDVVCRKCIKKRSERKEIITEIVETEEKYSRDLQIILEEFYQPMLVAGLLTPDQLSAIFLNVEELLENSQVLAERLRESVEIAQEQGDDDLLTVNMGKLFLEATPMLHAFETYCVRQGPASLLLASLEKEKELLGIFLRVSQMENTMLRRMNLNSFLMVPVQRVTKYPLLLARLYKVTPSHHDTRDQLKEAQHKIELHLNHMNSQTKDVPSKLWRRIGSSSGRRSSAEMDLVNIKLRKIAVDVLEWNHEEAKFALEGKLLFTQPTDNNWRKGRTIKLSPINALLVINGKPLVNRSGTEENSLIFAKNGAREAALLLVRDKNGRYSLFREPLYLDRCVIATDPAWQSYFEVQELLGKDTFIFKAEDENTTQSWYKQLQFHAQGMGTWRKRRNALANIMINGMGLRS